MPQQRLVPQVVEISLHLGVNDVGLGAFEHLRERETERGRQREGDRETEKR